MTGLLAAEWIKLRTRWMPRVVLLLLMLQSLNFVGRRSTGQGDHAAILLPEGWVIALIFAGLIGPYIWPVLGGSWAGGEYGWGTIGLVLSRRPVRIQFVGAALVTLLLFTAIGLIALMVTFSAACLLVAALTHTPAFDASLLGPTFLVALGKSYLAVVFVLGFYLALSYTAGTVFRSSTMGVAIGIGSSLAQLILASMFSRLGGLWAVLAAHFPFQYGQALVARMIDAFRTFDVIYVLTGGGPGDLTTSLSIYIYKMGFVNGNISQSSATSIIITLILIPFVPFLVRRILRQTGF